MQRIEIKAVFGLIIIAILTRLLPHPPNFAPITSIALFSGFHFANKRLELFIPLIAMFISDLFIGLHDLVHCHLPLFYFDFSNEFLHEILSFTNVILGSSVFFVLSNLGVWYFYYHDMGWIDLLLCFSHPVFCQRSCWRSFLHLCASVFI